MSGAGLLADPAEVRAILIAAVLFLPKGLESLVPKLASWWKERARPALALRRAQ